MNNEKRDIITLRQAREKELILEQLRRIPIIQVACEKVSMARATFYRLRNNDPDFKDAVEEAVAEGVAFITDMSESQLVTLIREKNFPAISLWLKVHHPKYGNKVEISGHIESRQTHELSEEDKQLIAKALRSALPSKEAPEEELAKT